LATQLIGQILHQLGSEEVDDRRIQDLPPANHPHPEHCWLWLVQRRPIFGTLCRAGEPSSSAHLAMEAACCVHLQAECTNDHRESLRKEQFKEKKSRDFIK
jgi:hypothetical protein